ncbi:MAG: hypothetical protein ACREN8_11290 [Candidatus Dormibacteraceae bacterium]
MNLTGIEGPAVTATFRMLSAASSHGWSWWHFRKKRSAAQKQGRVLYAEILCNLIACRLGQRNSPPLLMLISKEWDRPSTRVLLAELLPPEKVILVAAPYISMAASEWGFSQSWLQRLPLSITGTDVVLLGRLYDQFAEAEQILRGKLLPSKAQAAVAKAIEAYPSPVKVTVAFRRRVSNTYHSIPSGWRLSAMVLLGWIGCRRLVRQIAHRNAHKRPTKSCY